MVAMIASTITTITIIITTSRTIIIKLYHYYCYYYKNMIVEVFQTHHCKILNCNMIPSPPSFHLQIRDNFSRPLPTLYYSLPPTPITISTSGMGDNNNINDNDNGIMGDLFDFLERNIDGYDI